MECAKYGIKSAQSAEREETYELFVRKRSAFQILDFAGVLQLNERIFPKPYYL